MASVAMTITSVVAVYGGILSTINILRDYLSRRAKAIVRTGYDARPGSKITSETESPFAFAAKQLPIPDESRSS